MANEEPKPTRDASSDASVMAEIEGRGHEREGEPPPSPSVPAAGPHADPALTNPEATPGTGALPDPAPGGDADPGAE